MTEIPEHLLKRSKAAKVEASGGSLDPAGGDAASPASTGTPKPAGNAPVSSEPAALIEAAAAVPPDTPKPPEPADPPYIAAAKARKKMPVWAMGLVAAIPIWALSYAGTMQQPEVEDPLFVEAASEYGSCSACHGSSGGGGTGYALSGGEVLLTFPAPIDQMVHVARGSAAIDGEAYGDPERPGGQRVAGDRGVMPAHESLTQLQLELVVFHERAVLSGDDTSTDFYVNWMESLHTRISEGDEREVDLEVLLACATPGQTPGATEGDRPCPGDAPPE